MLPSERGERPTQVIYDPIQPLLVSQTGVLRVVDGPDKDASCSVGLHRVRVGTAPDCDLVLTDPLVSRAHLELQVQDEGYLLQDLGSTNGTIYRGARVREVLVGLDCDVRVGGTVLRLERGPERSEVIRSRDGFGGLIGNSPAMRQVYGLLTLVAPTDVTVLIEGETGTGKEMVAEEIHRQSPRRGGPFCVVDCGSIPANLIESELFGHERGSFTGAVAERQGAFERARGGVVFLDEVGELPLDLQTRLLRVLDRRIIKRLGSDFERKVDVRVIAATNRDLEAEVRERRFRQDLFFRLAVVRIVVPPLRERREDVPALARHFLWQAGCADPDEVLKPELLRVLATRTWPGNVRELRNLAERAVVLADRGGAALAPEPQLAAVVAIAPRPAELAAPPELSPREAEPGDLGWMARALPSALLDQPFKQAKERLVSSFEALYLQRLRDRFGSNISKLAQEAGIDRHMVRILMRKHNIGG
jgi:transcriptional regulator with GAF, ATPase, and Fis domain